jgi:reactive intermediate/imine deaminase
MRTLRTAALLLLFAPVAGMAQEARSYVEPKVPSDAGTPFSGAVRVGNTLYLSGRLGLTPDQKVPATAEEEATRVLDQVKATLVKAGMTMDDLVSVQIYCSDVSLYDRFNTIYRTYFTREFPARAFIGSGPLLFGARFEMVAVAVKR